MSDDSKPGAPTSTEIHEKARQPDGTGTGFFSPDTREKTGETMSTNLMDAPAQGLVLSDELEHELLGIFKLLSDETRLRILLYLGREQ